RAEGGHRFGIVGRELGERFGLAHRALESFVRHVVRRYDGMLGTERALNVQVRRRHASRGRDAVVGEAHVRGVSTAEIDLALVGLGELDRALDDGLRLFARHHARIGRARFPVGAHAFLPVLMTLTLRKRAGTQPWLTEPICPGWPLPSKE